MTVGTPLGDEFAIYRDDDQNAEVAGQGLACAPFMREALSQPEVLYWMMSPAEQAALVYLLSHMRPSIGIEIGTRYGGSLQVLAHFCSKVYSLDSDPNTSDRVQRNFLNVEYVPGSSCFTLPGLLARLERQAADVGFVLVDGDHSYSGVKGDIESVLKIKPRSRLLVVMHDSFIPDCRKALRDSEWASNEHVRYVELDFVPGTVNPSPAFRGKLCGGLALAYLTPEKRTGPLEITARAELTFQRLLEMDRK